MAVLDSWIQEIWIETSPLTQEGIEQKQLQLMNEQIHYARKQSTFYQYLPERIDEIKDLQKIPLVSSKQLIEEGHRMVCVSQSEIQRVVTIETSGTTGARKRVYVTKEDQERTIQFFNRGLSQVVLAGERMLVLMPAEREGSIGKLIIEALKGLEVEGIAVGLNQPFEAMAKVLAEGCETIVGSPGMVLSLARYMEAEGKSASVKRVLVSSDYRSQDYEQRLQQLWSLCEVFEHYGSTESGYGFAVQCSNHQGLHVRANDLFVEVIDSQGREVPRGQWGEIVFTTLNNKAMPLIRYRTGDYGRVLAEPCCCGSKIVTLDKYIERIATGAEKEQLDLLKWLDVVVGGKNEVIDYRLDKEHNHYCLWLMSEEHKFSSLAEEIYGQWELSPWRGYRIDIQIVRKTPEQWSCLQLGKRRVQQERVQDDEKNLFDTAW